MMRRKLIIVKSITHAMRGQSLLNSYNIKNTMERNIYAVEKYGCGYGLRVREMDLNRALKLLSENDFKIVEITD